MRAISIIAAAASLLSAAVSAAEIVISIPPMTVFSAGIRSGARQGDAARALVKLLTAPAAAPVIRKHGLEPA